jgi:superfamily II DNA or RNA helicase
MTLAADRLWRVGLRVFVRGRRWRVAAASAGEDCEALRLTAVDGSAPGASLTILVPFDRPIRQDRAVSLAVVRPRRWLHELDRLAARARPFGGLAATAHAAIDLMPYQLEPAIAVLRDGASRILIADAVGLGKTVQAGVLIAELHERVADLRALVLVPAGLREQWSNELRRQFGLCAVIADSAWLQRTLADRPPDVNPWSLPGTYITSHDFVKRPEVLTPLEQVSWDLAVIDEAHHANLGTDRRAAIDAIASRSLRVVSLTATPPIESSELEALYNLGAGSNSGNAPLVFARTRSAVDALPSRRSTVLAVTPSPAEVRMHSLLDRYSREVWKEAAARQDDGARLASIVLRKRALSSAGSLASSIDRRLDLLVSPEAEQIRLPLDDEDPLEDEVSSQILAAPGLADGRRERRWLRAIAEAARTASRAETKAAYLVRLLRRINEPAIVFTEYRDTLRRLERRLSTTGRSIVVLHGGMDPVERARIPAAWERGTSTLLATDAAAEGLNLHHRCRIVIHYELPWNPARLEQRAGRVDRIGQTKRVHEIALVASSTAERLVLVPMTLRAAHASQSPLRAAMLEALTESRIAEAVMSGHMVEAARSSMPDAAPVGSHSTVCADAVREAARLGRVRVLLKRSPAPTRTARTSSPFVSTVVLRHGWGSLVEDARRCLLLLYLVVVEAGETDIHDEIVVLRVPFAIDLRVERGAALREIIRSCVNGSDQVDRALKAAANRVRHEVEPRESARRTLLAERARDVHRIRRSRAQLLVQQNLFVHRRSRNPEGDTDPVTPDRPSASAGLELQTRTALVAALLVDGRRRAAS